MPKIPGAMRGCLWRCIRVLTSLVILGFFLQENIAARVEQQYGTLLSEKKKMMQQVTQEEISSEIKNHLTYFTEMQKSPHVLQHVTYTVLVGSSLQPKTLLTVGIFSVQHSPRTYLLETMTSLFQASSEQDLEYMLILVLLSDMDPKWLNQTVANISSLFMPQIESGKLLVVHGLLGGSRAESRNHTSPCGELYSRQKTSFALLMNFARNLSEYFLLLGDNVQSAPRFLSDIFWALPAWKQLPWVILDFSSMQISGKVFHSEDLSRLVSFLLLFPKDIPTHLLLSEFRLLLSQNVPIRLRPSIFYQMDSDSEFEGTCFPVEQDKDLGRPDNPPATVFTDMISFWNTMPQFAYILNDDYFWALDPTEGNYLLVVLDKPQKIIKVGVETGSLENKLNILKHGQLLLGYSPMEYPKRCAHYSLVGPLVRGHLEQMVFYEEDAVQEMSCVKLLVTGSHEYPVMILQIQVWTEVEGEED
ncbi:alpha-1,3-mannosyl-glycoprotein 4-beta-N-acetylglucosaminyltransferase-like protein MGAT4E isoform X2 [Mastomys coucha]|uniref:alpha-1,3-mannosyl-glycoprotein 4-beta-N-acetylglucosaminyltransferase-like protein MGAT4E isoform X2 n=1 Tax=Mastomys coucha TaxID=35658 RepID=UPI001261D3D7|nr:alpha-1,3-mannosyl-glycoprotein 4-beta-N-acetylglucosaminyltransferase-like protein MGAT4E isoform X2 [Mastomys coucha]